MKRAQLSGKGLLAGRVSVDEEYGGSSGFKMKNAEPAALGQDSPRYDVGRLSGDHDEEPAGRNTLSPAEVCDEASKSPRSDVFMICSKASRRCTRRTIIHDDPDSRSSGLSRHGDFTWAI
jgi:hypothetical protein